MLLPTPVVTNRAGMDPSPASARGTRGTDLGPAIGALLKTPTAQLAVNGGSQHPDKRTAGGHGPTLADQVEHLLPTPRAADGMTETMETTRARMQGGARHRGTLEEAAALLPTPTTTTGRNSRHHDTSRGDDLPEAIRYLPTPSVADGTGGHLTRSGDRGDELLLPGVAKALAAGQLLPTPGATDGKGGSAPIGRTREGRQRTPLDGDLPSAVGHLLPTPAARDGKGRDMPGRQGGKSLPDTLLPTPAAHDSGNTPEGHLRKKPGRTQVTSLQVIADHGLIPTGGRTSPPSGGGSTSPGARRHVQLSLGEPENG